MVSLTTSGTINLCAFQKPQHFHLVHAPRWWGERTKAHPKSHPLHEEDLRCIPPPPAIRIRHISQKGKKRRFATLIAFLKTNHQWLRRKTCADPKMTLFHVHLYFTGSIFWMIQKSNSFLLPNATELLYPSRNTEAGPASSLGVPRTRRKRYISARDMSALLDYHNQVRAQVSPPAANMEYMVWDERLARSAEAWAKQCIWEHGPPQLMKYIGQNLAIHAGRYHSAVDLVKSWYYEKQHYSFPYPYECKPSCPSKCSGSICSHYTQMVWASSNRIGCAIHTCNNMNVWGSTWRRAVYLVCNYAVKGNWVGEAPYKMGRPCSACPPSYGGTCSNNMCYSGLRSNRVNWF